MSTASKLALILALIETKKLETKSQDKTVSNRAKGKLIQLHQAKNYLMSQLELDGQRANIFKQAA